MLGLLGGLWLVWLNQRVATGTTTVQELAETGQAAFVALTLIELTAVLLVAPAATAGAICLDRTRGTLAHVFVTDLTNREVVLGKLAVRLFLVWGLLAGALPVMALATMLDGIDPEALIGAFLIAAGVAALGCSFALLLSVWADKAQEVLAVVFGAWMAWLLACPVYQVSRLLGGRPPNWLAWSNPFYLTYAPDFCPGETSLVEPGLFALACLVLGTGCTAVATWKVRVVACRSPRVRSTGRGRLVRRLATAPVRWPARARWGPKLDRDPVLWREWHRNRSTRWARLVWIAFALASSLGCGMAVVEKLTQGTNRVLTEMHGLFVSLSVTAGLLLLSTATASVLAEERARGSLDVLMCTPVSTWSIVRAKWWGAFRRVPPLALWVVVAGSGAWVAVPLGPVQVLNLALIPALIVAQGAMVASLGLALATRIRRTGAATVATIGITLASAVIWPLIGFLLLSAPSNWNGSRSPSREIWDLGQALGSPITGVSVPVLITLVTPGPPTVEADRVVFLCFQAAWVVGYALAAWGLFKDTARTFDRRLGRMPGRSLNDPEPAVTAQRLGLENS